MPLTGDLVKETTTTTGTGTLTLAGAVTGFRAVSDALAVGEVGEFRVSAGTELEVFEGTLLTSNTVSRDRVIASSNAGALVNFSAGTKEVILTKSAEYLNAEAHGPMYAMMFGLVMP